MSNTIIKDLPDLKNNVIEVNSLGEARSSHLDRITDYRILKSIPLRDYSRETRLARVNSQVVTYIIYTKNSINAGIDIAYCDINALCFAINVREWQVPKPVRVTRIAAWEIQELTTF